jgi:hypothetical protein
MGFVHKIVAFCFQFGYAVFKNCRYSKGMKVAEAAIRKLLVQSLFYLSSFHTPFAKSRRCLPQRRLFLLHIPHLPGIYWKDAPCGCRI